MCDTDGLKAGEAPNPECLKHIPYIGGCCQPQPDLEVDDNGVLTKRAILELVESLPVRNILSGSSYAEGAFMKLAQLAIEGYKAWLREKVKKLPIDIDSYTDICINLQAVLALLEKKP